MDCGVVLFAELLFAELLFAELLFAELFAALMVRVPVLIG